MKVTLSDGALATTPCHPRRRPTHSESRRIFRRGVPDGHPWTVHVPKSEHPWTLHEPYGPFQQPCTLQPPPGAQHPWTLQPPPSSGSKPSASTRSSSATQTVRARTLPRGHPWTLQAPTSLQPKTLQVPRGPFQHPWT